MGFIRSDIIVVYAKKLVLWLPRVVRALCHGGTTRYCADSFETTISAERKIAKGICPSDV